MISKVPPLLHPGRYQLICNFCSNSLLQTNNKPLALPCVYHGVSMVDVIISSLRSKQISKNSQVDNDGDTYCSDLPHMQFLQLHMQHVQIMMLHHVVIFCLRLRYVVQCCVHCRHCDKSSRNPCLRWLQKQTSQQTNHQGGSILAPILPGHGFFGCMISMQQIMCI